MRSAQLPNYAKHTQKFENILCSDLVYDFVGVLVRNDIKFGIFAFCPLKNLSSFSPLTKSNLEPRTKPKHLKAENINF